MLNGLMSHHNVPGSIQCVLSPVTAEDVGIAESQDQDFKCSVLMLSDEECKLVLLFLSGMLNNFSLIVSKESNLQINIIFFQPRQVWSV